MSQATQGAPAPATPPTQAVVGTPRAGAGRVRRRAAAYATLGTDREDEGARLLAARVPATLNRLRLVAVAVCLVFGALTALQLALSWQANRTAAADTEQLIRVQGIKTSLLRADALATNAFLIGGLEPAEQRAAYDDAIDQTVRAITDAADAQPADRAALNALQQRGPRLRRRHGAGAGQQPTGPAGRRRVPAQGQRRAALDRPADRRRARRRQLRPGHATRWAPTIPWWCSCRPWWPSCCCGWSTAGSGGRFHRRVNPGLFLALAAIGVVGIVAAFVTNGQQNQNDELSAGSFQTVVDGSTARTAANDAKANESLRLIARGSGQAFEDAWVAAAAAVDRRPAGPSLSGLQGSWSTYKSQHQEIVDLDTGGQWDEAVAAATSTEPGSSSDTFADFDAQLQDSLSQSGSITTDTLDQRQLGAAGARRARGAGGPGWRPRSRPRASTSGSRSTHDHPRTPRGRALVAPAGPSVLALGARAASTTPSSRARRRRPR